MAKYDGSAFAESTSEKAMGCTKCIVRGASKMLYPHRNSLRSQRFTGIVQ